MEKNRVIDRQLVLDVPVDSFSLEDLPSIYASKLATAQEQGQPGQVVFLRLWDLMRARRSKEFRTIVNRAALVPPVSIGISRGARFLKRRPVFRQPPFDVLIRLLAAVEQQNGSLYLLGGKKSGLHAAELALRQTFPGVRIVGRYTGYFAPELEEDIVTAIKKANPSVLFVGSGVNGGIKWVARHRSVLPPCLAVYTPDGFAIFAGKRRRPSKESFARGTDYFPDFRRRPWRLLRLPVYFWYLVLLLIHRIRKR